MVRIILGGEELIGGSWANAQGELEVERLRGRAGLIALEHRRC